MARKIQAARRQNGRPAEAPPEALLLTVDQAGRMLQLGRTKVYDLIRTGELHALHTGRHTRIARTDLDRYIARLRKQSA